MITNVFFAILLAMGDLHKLAHDFFERVWNQGDEKAIDEFLSDQTVGNDPRFGTGKESFRKQWRAWQSAFSDIHFEVLEVIAEGETVVTRWHLSGTQDGELEGVPATNKKVSVDGVSIDRIKDNQIIAGFDAWDELGFRNQLGLNIVPQ